MRPDVRGYKAPWGWGHIIRTTTPSCSGAIKKPRAAGAPQEHRK